MYIEQDDIWAYHAMGLIFQCLFADLCFLARLFNVLDSGMKQIIEQEFHKRIIGKGLQSFRADRHLIV